MTSAETGKAAACQDYFIAESSEKNDFIKSGLENYIKRIRMRPFVHDSCHAEPLRPETYIYYGERDSEKISMKIRSYRAIHWYLLENYIIRTVNDKALVNNILISEESKWKLKEDLDRKGIVRGILKKYGDYIFNIKQ